MRAERESNGPRTACGHGRVREAGKYLTVYAKQNDGSWKIVDDMTNPDAPAAPVAAKE